MIADKKILAVITARGGSKGLVGKNIKILTGKPLIAWTIDEAKKSKYIDRLILSSDDKSIIKVAREYRCEVPFVRPPDLAEDTSKSVDCIIHAIDNIEEFYDYVVLLQPTSPLRLSSDIDGCIELCINSRARASVSVAKVSKSPYWMYELDKKKQLKPLICRDKRISRRQDLPKVYVLNGAVYVAEINFLKEKKEFITDETVGYVMPKERSVDIDTKFDFNFASFLIQIRANNQFIY